MNDREVDLGDDFRDAVCLLNSEVAILLEGRQNRAIEEGDAEFSPYVLPTYFLQ